MHIPTAPDRIRRLLWDAADLAASLLLCVALNGVLFGVNDDYGFAPFVFKIENQDLYSTDIKFQTLPSPYFIGHFGYLYLVSRILPIEWASLGSVLMWTLVLLSALRRLCRQISGRDIPAVVPALFLAGFRNAHLIGGYWLASPTFSSHFPAIALALLGMSYFLDGRKMRAMALIVLSGIFNPRIGAFGGGLVVAAEILRMERAGVSILVGLGSLGALAAVFGSGHDHSREFGLDAIARLILYVRSPGHSLPSAWPPSVFVNSALVALAVGILNKSKTETAGRITRGWMVLCLVAILMGILNNLSVRAPVLVLASLFEFGPFALALAYVLLSVTVVERFQNGRYAAALAALLAPDAQTRFLILLSAEAVDRWPPPALGDQPHKREWLGLVIAAIGIAGLHGFAPTSWRQLPYEPDLLFRRASGVGIFAFAASGLVVFRRWNARTAVVCLVGCQLLVPAHDRSMLNIKINPGMSPEWREVCGYVRSVTPPSAGIITHPTWTGSFQYESRRATYANFFQVPLDAARIPEWLTRLGELRLLPPDFRLDMLEAPVVLNHTAYDTLTTEDFLRLRARHGFLDYALVRRSTDLDLELLFENSSYRLYQLAPAR